MTTRRNRNHKNHKNTEYYKEPPKKIMTTDTRIGGGAQKVAQPK